MIAEIDVLQHGHNADFSGYTGKQGACLLNLIAYHHKPVVKLRENCLPFIYTRGCNFTHVFRKVSHEFATHVELPPEYRVRDVFGRFGQPFKEVVLAIITEGFGYKRESHNFQIGKAKKRQE